MPLSFRDRAALAALTAYARFDASNADIARESFDLAEALDAERRRRDELSTDYYVDGIEDDGVEMRHIARCECGNFGRFGPTGRDPRCIVPSSDAAGDSDLAPDVRSSETSPLGPILAIESDLMTSPTISPSRDEVARALADTARAAASSSGSAAASSPRWCELPVEGEWCCRAAGHEGPCRAR